jgi:hypothetical protein
VVATVAATLRAFTRFHFLAFVIPAMAVRQRVLLLTIAKERMRVATPVGASSMSPETSKPRRSSWARSRRPATCTPTGISTSVQLRGIVSIGPVTAGRCAEARVA